MNGKVSKRYKYVDNAKLIGIFLVVLGHLNLYPSFLVKFIYIFHMPLFFFLAGLVQKNDTLIESIKKGARFLLRPYILFYVITYIWWIFAGFLPHPELYNRTILDVFVKPILGMVFAVGYNTKYSIMINVPLWFLPCLFFCKVFYSLTVLFNNIQKILINIFCSLIFIFLTFFIAYKKIFIPFSISSAFMSYPFFILGVFIFEKLNLYYEQKNKKHLFIIILISIISFLLVCFIASKNGRIDVSTVNYGNNIFLFYLGAYCGILFILCIVYLFQFPTIIDVFSKNTIIILAFHTIIIRLLLLPVKILFRNFSDNKVNIFFAIIISLICVLLHYFPISIINRFFPWVIGKKKEYEKL